jgi:hypothetical protein
MALSGGLYKSTTYIFWHNNCQYVHNEVSDAMGVSMLNKSFLKSVVLVAGLVSVNANASLITNGSFEDGAIGSAITFGGEQPALSFGDLATKGKNLSWAVFNGLPGWTHVAGYGPGVEIQYNGTLSNAGGVNNNAADGKHYAELDAHFSYLTPGNSNTAMFQLVSGLKIGVTYELSFWYRARTTDANSSGLNVYWKANGSTIDKSNANFFYDYSAAADNHANWVNYKQKVVATSTAMLVGFGGAGEKIYNPTKNTTAGGDGKGALVDMVSLVAVPAPATIALFGLAGLALVSRRRKA